VSGDWRASGSCTQTDPELFFPEKGKRSRDARAVCAGCPVCTECLADALAQGRVYGVWGGTTERERRKLTTTRRAA